MKRLPIAIALAIVCTSCARVCVLETNMGDLTISLFNEDAPNSCRQFQQLVTDGFYDGRDFYRVEKDFVIQTGGGDAPKLKAEFNDKKHLFGAVGLGHTGDPNGADSEIYLCLRDLPRLDGRYVIFGQLIEGFDVLEKIGNVEVEEVPGPYLTHRPLKKVLIKRGRVKLRSAKRVRQDVARQQELARLKRQR
jgi:peptidylprolyl isomerase